MAGEIIKTNIDGLTIRLNKVVRDEKGFLCELAPKGFEDELLAAGVKNIYAVAATQEKIARGGHHHLRQIENLFALSGTLLWVFADMRKESKSFGNVYAVVVGMKKPEATIEVPFYTIDQNQMAQITAPPGVYHIFSSLTKDVAVVVDASSEPYDKSDYAYTELSELPEVEKILEKFGVRLA